MTMILLWMDSSQSEWLYFGFSWNKIKNYCNRDSCYLDDFNIVEN